jgi:L-serine/L-threonine ammonia-lyase
MECWNLAHSFKIRGMQHLVAHHASKGSNAMICSSGGNAGYAAAIAARAYDVNLEVVLPSTTPVYLQDKIKAQGASIHMHGNQWAEADAWAREQVEARRLTYIHPFDDPLLWEGHSQMITELQDEMEQPELVIVSVGGGGLLAGVLKGLEKLQWSSSEVWAVETDGMSSFAKAQQAGMPVKCDLEGIASSLGANQVSASVLDLSMDFKVRSQLCSDEDCLHSCSEFFHRFQTLVEPACGASLSMIYRHPERLSGYNSVLVIVCGGIVTHHVQSFLKQQI